MPLAYERDDRRRLITITVTDPYTVEEVLRVIDRQAAENTWEYAMLYDLRAAENFADAVDRPRLAAHAKAVGGGRTRGAVCLWVAPRADRFQRSAQYSQAARGADVEVVLTDLQLAAWLARATKRG